MLSFLCWFLELLPPTKKTQRKTFPNCFGNLNLFSFFPQIGAGLSSAREIVVLDHKRSNAINIGLTKLPPPRIIRQAVLKMDSSIVNKEGVEKLLTTMLPSEEEAARIRLAPPPLPYLLIRAFQLHFSFLAAVIKTYLMVIRKITRQKVSKRTFQKDYCTLQYYSILPFCFSRQKNCNHFYFSRSREAQEAQPGVPLGTAEQFLLTLASVPGLEARLRLWAFKMEFESTEKEVCDPLMDLKTGMEALRANATFR